MSDEFDPRDEAAEAVREARLYLAQRAALGELLMPAAWTPSLAPLQDAPAVTPEMPHVETGMPKAAPAVASSAVAAPEMPRAIAAPPSFDRATPEILAALESLRVEVAACTKCPLHLTRTNPVFGVGSCRTGIMFVGEGPGENEDLRGEPFVGRAGELLTRAIEGGLKLTRDDVYIANIVKSRPPGNRVPTVEEAEACLPYLRQQIALLRPTVLVALGLTAATWLLVPKGQKATLASLRGATHDFHGIPTIATYHPAAILRNPNFKRPFWEDLQVVMRIAGLPLATGEQSV